MKVIRIFQVLIGLVAAGLVALILVSDLSGPGRGLLDRLEAVSYTHLTLPTNREV